MPPVFDPYHKWLGISPKDQPPNHYRLLGLDIFESDVDVIDAAANRQMAYVQQRATGEHAAESQRLLNELSAARVCLLDGKKKAAYDSKLKQKTAPPITLPPLPDLHGIEQLLAEERDDLLRQAQQAFEEHDYETIVTLLEGKLTPGDDPRCLSILDNAKLSLTQIQQLSHSLHLAWTQNDTFRVTELANEILSLQPSHQEANEALRWANGMVSTVLSGPSYANATIRAPGERFLRKYFAWATAVFVLAFLFGSVLVYYQFATTPRHSAAVVASTESTKPRNVQQTAEPPATSSAKNRITVPDDIATLDSAIRQAAPGATVVLKSGTYRYPATLRLTRPVTIIGATGTPKDVVLECMNGSAIVMDSTTARIEAVSIRGHGEADTVFANQGTLELVQCDIAGESKACVASVNATVIATSCTLHGGAIGVAAMRHSKARIDKCEVYDIAGYGVAANLSTLTVMQCKLHDINGPGIAFISKSEGTVEKCDLFHNGCESVCIVNGCNATVKDCKIHDGKQSGVNVQRDAGATFERCEIFGNAEQGIAIAEDSKVTATDCKIHDNKRAGVLVTSNASGTFEQCDIFRNTAAGVQARQGGSLTVKGCRIHDGEQFGVIIEDGGAGVFANNTIQSNARGAWSVKSGAGVVQRIGNSPNY